MDVTLFYLINLQWTAPWLDWVMAIASSASLWLPLLIALVVAIAIWGGFTGRAMVACAALTLATASAPSCSRTASGARGRTRR